MLKMLNLQWVDDCALESDLEMYFPDHYVPSDSERMLLYRELDNLAGNNNYNCQLSTLNWMPIANAWSTALAPFPMWQRS